MWIPKITAEAKFWILILTVFILGVFVSLGGQRKKPTDQDFTKWTMSEIEYAGCAIWIVHNHLNESVGIVHSPLCPNNHDRKSYTFRKEPQSDNLTKPTEQWKSIRTFLKQDSTHYSLSLP